MCVNEYVGSREVWMHLNMWVMSAQSCPTFANPRHLCHGIFQARILEWAAIPFFKGSSPPRDRTHVSCEWKSLSCVQLFVTLYSPGNSTGQNSGADSLSLLQGIFPTQGSNPGLPNCRQLSHKGNPRILEWVAYPFSNRSSWLGNPPGISCTAHRFLPTELSGKPTSLISPVLQELAPCGKPWILIRKLL